MEELQIEFGKFSPVNINCSDGDIKLEQLIPQCDITLLNDLFIHPDDKRPNYTDEQKNRLNYLDKYLDIPFVEAVLNPSYDALYRLLENNCKNIPISLKRYVLCQNVAANGHLDVLKWARENGCPWNEWTCTNAAENGHLDVLKWARENGCPWDEWTCEYAAGSGHLDVLKWARENGCPWDEDTCSNATKNGHLDVLR